MEGVSFSGPRCLSDLLLSDVKDELQAGDLRKKLALKKEDCPAEPTICQYWGFYSEDRHGPWPSEASLTWGNRQANEYEILPFESAWKDPHRLT